MKSREGWMERKIDGRKSEMTKGGEQRRRKRGRMNGGSRREGRSVMEEMKSE